MHGALFIYSLSSSLRINPINQSVLCAVTIFSSFCDCLDYLVYYDYFCLRGWPEVFLASIRACYRYQSCKYGEPMVFAGSKKNQKSEGLGAKDGFFGSISGSVWIEVDIVRLHIDN